jgi:vancomycin resistance protein YoaR
MNKYTVAGPNLWLTVGLFASGALGSGIFGSGPAMAQTAREEYEYGPTPLPAPQTQAPVSRPPAPVMAPTARFGAATVAGVSIDGLNTVEATRRLTRELAPKLNAQYALTDGKRFAKRRRRDLGAHLNLSQMLARAASGESYVPLILQIDETVLQAALQRMAPTFALEPRDAKLLYAGGKVSIVPEQNWQRLDVGTSVPRVVKQIEANAGAQVLTLTVQSNTPKLTAARLKGIDGVIGTYTTRFDPGNVGRTTNMRVAIGHIDGALLADGKTFSLNDTVGERTEARGFKKAIIFENGLKVEGLGGGVSQVTGTLFNAALEAGLPIVSYRTHSRPVAYLSLGRDATVAWGQFDMKFRNNTGAPIYISYKAGRNRATVTLFGRKIEQDVSVRVLSQNIGPREIKAQLFRTIRRGDVVVTKQRVGSSHYKWKEDKPED